MRERGYRPSLVGPLILITIGVLLLLNQMGRLSWDIWWSLWRYWPVILILLGLEVLVGISRSRVLYLLGLLVAVAILIGVVSYAALQGSISPAARPVTATETISQRLQDADHAVVTLRLAAGAIHVRDLADSPNLMEGRIEYAEESGQVEQHFAVHNGRAEFDLRGRQEGLLWRQGSKLDEAWQLQFTPRIPLEMRLDMAAGRIEADLSALQITRLDLNMAAGSIALTLPKAEGATTARIELAVGGVTIVVPPGVGVKMSTNKLLSSLNVDEARFTRSGNDWVSDNYATAPSKIDLHIDNVIGSINVR